MSSRNRDFTKHRWDRIRKSGYEPDITEVRSGGVKYVVIFFFWMVQSDWLFGGSTKDTAPCGYSLCAGARPSLVSISSSTLKTQDHSSPNLHSWIFILPVVFGYLLALKFEGPGWFFSLNLIKSCPIHQFPGHSLPVQERLGAPYRNIRGRDIGRAKKRWGSFKLNTCKNHVFLMFHADFPPKNNNHWVVMVEKMGAETNKPVTMNEELAISGCFAKTGSQKAECWNSLILQDPSLVSFSEGNF